MHKNADNMPDELSQFVYTHDMCKYIGELCGEQKNITHIKDGSLIKLEEKKTLLAWAVNKLRNKFDEQGRIGASNLLQAYKITRRNDVTGLDLSYLDLRRTTFSHIVCGYKDFELGTNFDGCIIDRWTFRTFSYSKDNADICINVEDNQILYTNNDCVYSMDLITEARNKIVALKGDYIQSIDYDNKRHSLLITYLHHGIEELNLKTKETINRIPTEEGVMIGCAKYCGNYIIYTTRDRKIVLYNPTTSTVRCILPCNSSTLTVINDNWVVSPSRDRDMYSINIDEECIDKIYNAETTMCGYITKTRLSTDRKHILAVSKEGVFIVWDTESADPSYFIELNGDINDFEILGNETIYCLSEQIGIIKINLSNKKTQDIGIPFANTWTKMLMHNQTIFILSTEGSIVKFDCLSESFSIIIEESENATVPFICAYNSSFKHLDAMSTMDDRVRSTLLDQGCVF